MVNQQKIKTDGNATGNWSSAFTESGKSHTKCNARPD